MTRPTGSSASIADEREGAFRHTALFYAGEASFVDAVAAFLRDGVAAGEPALVVVSARKIELLRDELGDSARAVLFVDLADVGANPGAIISAWDDFLAAHASEGLRVRGVGEPVHPGRSPAELTECHQHEALLNLAFADASSFWLVCPYDADALDADVLEHALQTHPRVLEDGIERESATYAADETVAAVFESALDEPPAGSYEVAFDRDSLGAMRRFVGELAVDAGIRGTRRYDLLLAVNELATNSVRHGGGGGTLRAWHEPNTVVCEITDSGHLGPPLAGRLRPRPGAHSGYGLWLVNQVCDLVQVRAGDGGTVVRMSIGRG